MKSEARAALADFAIAASQWSALPTFSNRVWRVDTQAERYVLRITPATNTSAARLATEFRWLTALNEETELPVPTPLPTRSGDPYTRTSQGDYASLFRWLPGETLRTEDMDAQTLAEMGSFVAQLHQHASRFRPAAPISPTSYRAADLFGPGSPYLADTQSPEDSIMTAETRATIAAVAKRFRQQLAHLNDDPNVMGMIHGDLVAKNWLRGSDGLALIDFDHCGMGAFLYDLATICIQLLDEPAFPQLRAALLASYSRHLPLPADHDSLLDVCIVTRYAASCLWMEREGLKPDFAAKARAALAFRTEQLRHYLASGQLPGRGELF